MYAKSLACGLAGINHKIQPDQAYQGNAGDEEIRVPRSLEEALRGLKDIDDVADILGAEFINAYRHVKLEEFEQYNQVISAWEREHLLLNV